jgi:hypothetical protein
MHLGHRGWPEVVACVAQPQVGPYQETLRLRSLLARLVRWHPRALQLGSVMDYGTGTNSTASAPT